MPSWRRPATRVVIFWCPCGTLATSRLPRRQRPRSRVMLVEVPVWSTKMGFLGSKPRLRAFPVCTCDANVLAVLFGGVQAFFESDVVAVVEPPHRTGAHPDATRTHRSRPRISSIVKSGSAATSSSSHRWCASSSERLPPISLAATDPVCRRRATHRSPNSLTSNAAAASWQDAPASIERTTRSRRSRE